MLVNFGYLGLAVCGSRNVSRGKTDLYLGYFNLLNKRSQHHFNLAYFTLMRVNLRIWKRLRRTSEKSYELHAPASNSSWLFFPSFGSTSSLNDQLRRFSAFNLTGLDGIPTWPSLPFLACGWSKLPALVSLFLLTVLSEVPVCLKDPDQGWATTHAFWPGTSYGSFEDDWNVTPTKQHPTIC